MITQTAVVKLGVKSIKKKKKNEKSTRRRKTKKKGMLIFGDLNSDLI